MGRVQEFEAHGPDKQAAKALRTSPKRSGEPDVGVVVGVDGSASSEDAIA
jgi:hypothetical protein